jgi:hypothetical protein
LDGALGRASALRTLGVHWPPSNCGTQGRPHTSLDARASRVQVRDTPAGTRDAAAAEPCLARRGQSISIAGKNT